MPTKILVLDPLTLAGRELLGCDQRLTSIGGELDFRHTGLDDESQIAELPTVFPPATTISSPSSTTTQTKQSSILPALVFSTAAPKPPSAPNRRHPSSSGSPIRQSSRR
jgi:hypothetical protein